MGFHFGEERDLPSWIDPAPRTEARSVGARGTAGTSLGQEEAGTFPVGMESGVGYLLMRRNGLPRTS